MLDQWIYMLYVHSSWTCVFIGASWLKVINIDRATQCVYDLHFISALMHLLCI